MLSITITMFPASDKINGRFNVTQDFGTKNLLDNFSRARSRNENKK